LASRTIGSLGAGANAQARNNCQDQPAAMQRRARPEGGPPSRRVQPAAPRPWAARCAGPWPGLRRSEARRYADHPTAASDRPGITHAAGQHKNPAAAPWRQSEHLPPMTPSPGNVQDQRIFTGFERTQTPRVCGTWRLPRPPGGRRLLFEPPYFLLPRARTTAGNGWGDSRPSYSEATGSAIAVALSAEPAGRWVSEIASRLGPLAAPLKAADPTVGQHG